MTEEETDQAEPVFRRYLVAPPGGEEGEITREDWNLWLETMDYPEAKWPEIIALNTEGGYAGHVSDDPREHVLRLFDIEVTQRFGSDGIRHAIGGVDEDDDNQQYVAWGKTMVGTRHYIGTAKRLVEAIALVRQWWLKDTELT